MPVKSLGLLLVSIFLAFIFWMQMNLLSFHTTNIKLPLRFSGMQTPNSYGKAFKTIIVKVTGKGIDLLKLKLTPTFMLSSNPSDENPNTGNIRLISSNANNIKIHDVINVSDEPSHLSTQISKSVPIRLQFANPQVKNKFNSEGYVYSPMKLNIFGKSSLVDKCEYIQTQHISMVDLERNRITINLISPDKGIVLSDYSILISTGGTTLTTRTIWSVPIEKPNGVSIFPDKVNVRVSGTKDKLDLLHSYNLQAMISMESAINGFVPIKVRLPKDIKVIEVSPDKAYIND